MKEWRKMMTLRNRKLELAYLQRSSRRPGRALIDMCVFLSAARLKLRALAGLGKGGLTHTHTDNLCVCLTIHPPSLPCRGTLAHTHTHTHTHTRTRTHCSVPPPPPSLPPGRSARPHCHSKRRREDGSLAALCFLIKSARHFATSSLNRSLQMGR